MDNVPWDTPHRVDGAPPSWDETLDGPFINTAILEVVDIVTGIKMLATAWRPSAEELADLNNGGYLILKIADCLNGKHPIIQLYAISNKG